MAQHRLVVIEDSTLMAMANDARFIAELPFLTSLKSVRKAGCGRCGAKNQQRAETFQAAKRAIAGLAAEKKRKIKQLFNAHEVRVIYRTPANKVVKLTF